LTNSNGGFVTNVAASDPGFVLEEQFCLARTYAIAEGEDMARRVSGVTTAQLEQQCGAFGPAMASQIGALATKPYDAVVQDVTNFAASTGMSPTQLAGTAKICLSVGYRTDNMDVAIGSALLLTAMGEPAYGELLGHHLTQGFGTTAKPDLAMAWYQTSFDAINNGATAVFVPGNPDRNALIQDAAYQLNNPGIQGFNFTPGESVQPISTLPTFSLGSDESGKNVNN
jgi:hypothetical protein